MKTPNTTHRLRRGIRFCPWQIVSSGHWRCCRLLDGCSRHTQVQCLQARPLLCATLHPELLAAQEPTLPRQCWSHMRTGMLTEGDGSCEFMIQKSIKTKLREIFGWWSNHEHALASQTYGICQYFAHTHWILTSRAAGQPLTTEHCLPHTWENGKKG